MTIMDTEYSEETREASPTNLLIKIKSFSLLTERGIENYETRTFNAGGYKWKLVMDFEGDEKGDFSVYFSIADSDSLHQGWEFNAIFTFFIYNHLQDNYSCLSLIKDAFSYKLDWKISNVSKLENVWNSEEFEVGNHNWKVLLYPKGNSSRVKDRYMSMYVECVDSKDFAPHRKLKAKVIMRIKSKLNNAIQSKEYEHWFTSSAKNWGFPEYIPIADMSSRGFLVDDCLFLEVEITVQALALDAPKI